MSAFPILKTGAVMQYPAARGSQRPVCVLRFLDGEEQRFRLSGKPLRRWIIRLDLLDEEEMAQVEEFFAAQQGRLGGFTFVDPWDGATYPNCRLEADSLALEYMDAKRGCTMLVVREGRD